MKKLTVALCLSLAGCATYVPPQKTTFDGLSDDEFCYKVGQLSRLTYIFKDPELRARVDAERQKRNLLPDDQLERASRGVIRVGDPICAMYAGWGFPTRRNVTTTSRTQHIQHVYYGGDYAYTENGVITAIQN